MSGTFKDIDVPPTLISFALTVGDAKNVITPEFKKTGTTVCVTDIRSENGMETLSTEQIKKKYDYVAEQIQAGNIISAYAVGSGGYIEAVSKMALGNEVGFEFSDCFAGRREAMNTKFYGEIVVEFKEGAKIDYEKVKRIGKTKPEKEISIWAEKVSLDEILKAYESKLEPVFRTKTNEANINVELPAAGKVKRLTAPEIFIPKSRKAEVVIPVFPGTNSEDEMGRAFRDAGAVVKEVLIRNLTSGQVSDSAVKLAKAISSSDIVAIPGGFSGGDEPDGSAKLIVSLFRNPEVTQAVNEMLAKKDGLMLGICNGFQALAKLGMFRNGQISKVDETYPTLGTNTIARHVSEYPTIKVTSVKSPWLSGVKIGEQYRVPVSHGEGKFLASDEEIASLVRNGQIFSQYVDPSGKATMLRPFNPNGSKMAIEGIISPDGRVLGKMGHCERVPERGQDVIGKNIPGNIFIPIIPAGVEYIERTR